MRIHHFLVLAGAAVLSLSAWADPSVAGSAAVTGATPARHDAPSAYRLDRDEAQHMRAVYLLADGRTVAITSDGGRLFANLDGKREELVRTGWTNFVSRDTGARLAFNRVPYADEVVLDQAAR